jgi:adenylate cyclase
LGIEIERKFIVINDNWRADADLGFMCKQGYFFHPNMTIRIRHIADEGFITFKSKVAGMTRKEYEYAIPKEEAIQLLEDCDSIIVKTRHMIRVGDDNWVVDDFEKDSLVLAEIELTSETDTFAIPSWVGKEVTDDSNYYNANIAWKHWRNT